MKKLIFALLGMIFGLFFSCSPSVSKSDFYGTWVYKDDELTMEYVITENTITATFSMLATKRSAGYEIISWKKVRSTDNLIKAGWLPMGFMLELRLNGQAGSETFFISHPAIYLINSAEPTYIYIKQD